MTHRPTPETDALTALHAASGADNMTLQYVDMRALSRKIERQRDDAVELLRRMLLTVSQAVGPQIAGADSNDPVKQWVTDANAFLARLEKERQT